MKQLIINLFLLICILQPAKSSNWQVRFVEKPQEQKVDIFVNDIYFTTFIYADSLKKQTLFPIHTASGKAITRGYPLSPRAGEKTDHPHQVGWWFSFGDVEGLDFWNHSSSVPPSEACKYGTIRFDHLKVNPEKGSLVVEADWVDCNNKVFLHETTTFEFLGETDWRSIHRETKLTAVQQNVRIKENKEGLIGLRVARELEADQSGVYTNSFGDKGKEVWGKRSPWVDLSGTIEGENIFIRLYDHPENPNYPGWSHARGYGLFAHNNLGGTAFGNEEPVVDINLKKGESLTFIYNLFIKNESIIQQKRYNKQ